MMACVFYGPVVLPGSVSFLSRYPMRWCCLFIPDGVGLEIQKLRCLLNLIISLQIHRTGDKRIHRYGSTYNN